MPNTRPATRRTYLLLDLAALGLAVFVFAYLCVELPRNAGAVAPIWLANAVVLASLMSSSRRRWPAIAAIGFIGLLVANLLTQHRLSVAVGLALCNTIEFTISAIALRSLHRRAPHSWRPRDWTWFGAVAIAVPAACAAIAMAMVTPAGQPQHIRDLGMWAGADALGLLVLTPCLLILGRAKTAMAGLKTRDYWPFLVLAGATLLSFGQDRMPIQFFPAAALIVVTWKLRTPGAALGLLLLGLIATPLTMLGFGPFSMEGTRVEEPVFALQVYLAVCFFFSVPVAAQSERVGRLHKDLRHALADARAEAHKVEMAQARFRMLAENASDLILQTGVDRLVSYVSPSIEPMTGYTPDEVVGRSAIDFVHPDDRERVRDVFLAQVRKTPGPPQSVEYRMMGKDGRVIWVECRPTALIDPETGAPMGVTDVARDVTARHEMECELRRARAEAEAAAKVKSEFLANMSHELRTPLTSVVGFTRLVSEQPELSDLTQDYVDRVSAASQALLCTVNDILDFSKLEAGQVAIRAEPISPVKTVRTALDLFLPQAGAKDLALTLDCDLDPAVLLELDPDRIRQILLNLIGNAVKFTDAGEVAVRMTFDGERLDVAVRDTGAGIPPDRLDLLFKRFSQVDGSLTRAHSGTGLGLAICKGLVEAMGGEIGVDSVVGEGSCFRFSIPAKISTRRALAEESGAGAIGVPGVRVLVVDDHAANRELARLFLAGVGAEVTEAADGAEAVRLAAEWPFDVILMDLRMPKLDGAGAMAAIRAQAGPNDATPILAFTADADVETAKRMEGLGFQGMVAKPLEPATLIGAIARAIAFEVQWGGDDERLAG